MTEQERLYTCTHQEKHLVAPRRESFDTWEVCLGDMTLKNGQRVGIATYILSTNVCVWVLYE